MYSVNKYYADKEKNTEDLSFYMNPLITGGSALHTVLLTGRAAITYGWIYLERRRKQQVGAGQQRGEQAVRDYPLGST